MSKGAKHPDKTGQRCLVCYAWEIKINDKVKIEHEDHCPLHRP